MQLLNVHDAIYKHFHGPSAAACRKFFLQPQNANAYAAYYNSMYLIQDTGEAVLTHMAGGFSPDPMQAYLEFWGVMQAINIQQDAIFQVHQAVIGSVPKPGSAWEQLRNTRHLCAGHPANRAHGVDAPQRTFMGRNFGTYDRIQYELWDENTGQRTNPTFNLRQMINDYDAEAMVSGLTILRADETAEFRKNWSYVILAEQLRRVVEDAKKDAKEVFRRMCFNALISNTDDHPRNHAIIAKEKSWKLSPAYDLTPSVPVRLDRRDLALDCGDMGRYANATNILSQHARFLIDRNEAEKIVSDMKAQVQATWYDTARASAVSEKDAEMIRGAFVYPGFSL